MVAAKGNKKRRRQNLSDAEKNLEESVFGKNLLETSKDDQKKKKKKDSNRNKEEAADDSEPAAAWEDEDDDNLQVNLDETDRLKKLKKMASSNIVSGKELSSLLRERFQTRKFAWANTKHKDTNSLLQEDGAMLSTSSRPALLPPDRIDIRRLADANIAEPSKKNINTVRFHANGSLLMVGGEDKFLRFFRIDGETNEKRLSVRFNDMSIKTAEFLGGAKGAGEVIVGGRRPYFYSYDVGSGSITKIPGCRHKEIKSHEVLATSPSSASGGPQSQGYIAVAGASGYVHLLSGKMKTWIGDVKLSSGGGVRAINFLSDTVLSASGQGAEVCLWDLRMISSGGGSGLISRFQHEDGTHTSSLASAGVSSDQWMAVGAESGAVSFFHSAPEAEQQWAFQRRRTVLNLTTKVTALAFHPSVQLAAAASDRGKDQLRLVHLPSGTVFSNWPTERSPLGRVRCLDFSPGGGFLSLGDHRGRVLLYRLNHFDSA